MVLFVKRRAYRGLIPMKRVPDKPFEVMSVVVQTKYGKVRGVCTKDGYVWRGIPYAAPPVGKNRFKAPQDPQGWQGVYDAQRFRAICPQFIPLEKEVQSEDCLHLNIYSDSTIGRKPVMVFIHGGAFILGSGSQSIYDCQNIAAKGVVAVTLNYRLGVFGMLNFSFIDESFASNIALRDQIKALEWVYENIANFGGDPEDITICGQSAGAISVTCLLNAPAAQPYIKKAIICSSFPDMINSKQRSVEIAKDFLKFIGIEEKDAPKRLLSITVDELNMHAKAFTKNCRRKNGLDLLMPCVDGMVLPKKPLASVRDGSAHYVPLLIGVTKSEVDILFRLKYSNTMANDEMEYLLEDEKQVKEELLAAYNLPPKKAYPLIGRDWLIRIPSEWYANSHSKKAPVWMYRFDYENLFLKLTGMNAVHALDLLFIFKNFDNRIGRLLFCMTPRKAKAMALADRMQDAVVDFIKSGKAPWQQFDEKFATKVFDADGDKLEYDDEDAVRKVWLKTEIYKRI